MAVLEARELYRFFHGGDDETLALRGVSLMVDAGEVVAVTGPSGSGKSTLLACLAGLDDPDGGSVRVDGQVISRRPEPERAALRATRIGVLLQSGNLIEHLNVEDNVAMAMRLGSPRGRPGRGARERRADVLADVGLSDRCQAWPSQLSGGETARAGLAVALANRPAVLLADEPTGELDGDNESRVVALLQVAARGGAAVVVVTHSAVVAASATRQLNLQDGRIDA